MRKESKLTYLLLVGTLLILMSLPQSSVERFRSSAVAVFSFRLQQKGKLASQEENQRLQLENQLLHSEVERLQELVQHELFLKEVESIHSQEVQNYLSLQMEALPARVIFRSPGTWNSSIWINVGSSDNGKLDRPVVAKK